MFFRVVAKPPSRKNISDRYVISEARREAVWYVTIGHHGLEEDDGD